MQDEAVVEKTPRRRRANGTTAPADTLPRAVGRLEGKVEALEQGQKNFATANKDEHTEIRNEFKGYHTEVMEKLDEIGKACVTRKIACDDDRRRTCKDTVEKIAEAKAQAVTAAIAGAKEPGIYTRAALDFGERFKRQLQIIGYVVGPVGTVIGVLGATHHL